MDISPRFEMLSAHCDIFDVYLPFPGQCSIIWNDLSGYLWLPQAEEIYVIFETDVKISTRLSKSGYLLGGSFSILATTKDSYSI